MDHNLIAIILVVVAIVVGGVILIRSRIKRSKGSGKPGGAPFGVDNNER